jgi:hypothetical protein
MTIDPADRLIIRDGAAIAGVYIFGDPSKSFVHELATPSGSVVTSTRPSDHYHHTGLFYGLKSHELVWWESLLDEWSGPIGRQRHIRFDSLITTGPRVSFTQINRWESLAGDLPSFDETRTITVERAASAFVWTWSTRLLALRDMRLIKSYWSNKHPDGRTTNYHGLGIRFARDMSGKSERAVFLDGVRQKLVNDGMGTSPQSVAFESRRDGTYPRWPGPVVRITVDQLHAHRNGLYLRDNGFSTLGLGPSNLEERSITQGESLEESYRITVADVAEENTIL